MSSTDISINKDVHHAHDEHDHHHDQNFFEKYIFSQDHKVIAKQFLFAGIFWGFVGGFLSVIFRLQLGWPEATFTFLEPILGGWIVNG